MPPRGHRGNAQAAAWHLELPGWFEQGHTAQESERVGMLEPRGHDSALNTRGVTGRGMGRVTNVTCQALPTLEALLDGREGGQRAVLDVLSWWSREAMGEREL